MASSSALDESARREIADLVLVHQLLVRRVERLRASRAAATTLGAEEKAVRCEHLTQLLDNRIRLAAQQLAQGAAPPVRVEPGQLEGRAREA